MAEPCFFLDENLSRRIAKALTALGHRAEHLLDHLPQGTPDTEYFPFVAEKGWFVLTQDQRIRKRPHERKALLDAEIGAFILTGRATKSVDQTTIQLLGKLEELKKLAEKTKRPFIFGISDRGKIERLT